MVVKTKNRNKSSNRCVYVCVLSPVWLFATPWTVAWQAPLSVGFYREEYWSRLPFPSPGDLPDPGTEHSSPVLQVDSLLLSHRGRPQTEMQPLSSGKKEKTSLHFLLWTEWFFFLDLFLEWHKSNRLSKKWRVMYRMRHHQKQVELEWVVLRLWKTDNFYCWGSMLIFPPLKADRMSNTGCNWAMWFTYRLIRY